MRLLILLNLLPVIMFCQKNNNWYFSEGLGLNFDSSPPLVLTDGAISSFTEGVSTVSDPEGKLLFYTNGETVWNKEHNIMENGEGLLGHHSATQSALIVPFADDSSKYFVFTTFGKHYMGFSRFSEYNYSVVDISLNNSLGKVISKNNFLIEDVSEKQIAIKGDCHNWVITHQSENNWFYAFKIANGQVWDPIISKIGSTHQNVLDKYDNVGSTGQMTSSSDGKIIAAGTGLGILELFNFDKETGELSKPIKLKTQFNDTVNYNINGLSFSANDKKLYVGKGLIGYFNSGTSLRIIDQYDLTQYDSIYIENSRTFISNVGGVRKIVFDLALGPDNKIYVKQDNTGYLGVINNPNLTGLACNYDDKGIFLNNFEYDGNGLQNHVISPKLPSILPAKILPEDQIICALDTLKIDLSNFGDQFLWQDGTNTANYSIISEGKYWVNVMNGNCTLTDTILIMFSENSHDLDLGEDLTICSGKQITLSSNIIADSYQWNTGQTSNQISIRESGTYYLTAVVGTCTLTDTILVTLNEASLDLGEDISNCTQEPLLIDAQLTDVLKYIWSTGETTPSIQVYESGMYWVEAEIDGGCVLRDSIIVTFQDELLLDLGQDISTCDATQYSIQSTTNYSDYLWNTGDTTSLITITESGSYWLEVSVGNCTARDSINIEFFNRVSMDLGPDIIECNKNSVLLESPIEGTDYLWNTSETTKSIEINQTGLYTLEVTTAEGCSISDSILVTVDEIFVDLGEDEIICEGDSVVVTPLTIEADQYYWSNGISDNELLVTNSGSYWLQISNDNCTASDTIYIEFENCEESDTTNIVNPMEENCQVYVPNAISYASVNELNKKFQLFSDCEFAYVEISIYDRWGNLLQITNNSTIIDQNNLQPGVYVTKILYRFGNDSNFSELLQSITIL